VKTAVLNKIVFAACAWTLSTGLASDANAQAYPSKPITVIWPYAAGSGSALAHKKLMEVAAASLGQTLVFEYRGGAGGRLGVMAVSKAPSDGHLLTFATDAVLTVAPLASSSFKADLGADYEPVTIATDVYQVITGHLRLPFNDLAGWLDYAKKNPGKLTFGSTGVGGAGHMHFEALMEKTGMVMTHVPYKGQMDALSDRLESRLDVWTSGPDVRGLVESGKLKALVAGSPRRLPGFPNTPTLSESGYPGLVLTNWIAFVAPPKTPAATLEKLNAAMAASAKSPEVIQILEKAGFEITASSREAASATIKSALAQNGPIIKRLNLKID
jgi:tripartite-type tricarboxylate transporter receptor subunit TctC